jgi:hypothetical protein
MLNGRKVLYAAYPQGSLYTQQMFIQYMGTGCVLTILGNEGISKENFIALVNYFDIELCDESLADERVNFFEYLENYSPDKLLVSDLGKKISRDTVIGLNQQFELDGCNLAVNKVTFYDNVLNFGQNSSDSAEKGEESTEAATTQQGDNSTSQDSNSGAQAVIPPGFTDSMQQSFFLFANPDGSLPLYYRNKIVAGNGYLTPAEKIVGQDIVRQKFCLIQLTLTNNGKRDIDSYNVEIPLVCVTEKDGEFYRDETSYDRPPEVEKCRENNLPVYFSEGNGTISLKAGETKTIQLGYFTDEDEVSKIMILGENSVAESPWKVDIRQ